MMGVPSCRGERARKGWWSLLLAGCLVTVATVVVSATSDDVAVRKAALLAAIDFEGLTNSLASGILQDPYPISRILAARALASEADAARLRLVGEYARDGDPWVRYQTMIAAGRMAPDGLSVAARGLNDPAPLVRQAAMWAASHHGEAAYQTVMQHLLTERDPSVLETGIANLWRLGDGPWEEQATRYAQHTNPVFRRAAASTLARSERPQRGEGLRQLAVDAEPVIRATAIEGYRRGSVNTADREVILTAVSDGDWRVQTAVCQVLAARPEVPIPEAAGAEMAGLWTSMRSQLAVTALAVGGSHPEIGDDAKLRSIAITGEPWPASEALVALARRNATEATKIASGWIDGGELWRRRAAARTSAIVDPPGGKLERRVLADREPVVRLAWLESLDQDAAVARSDTLWGLLQSDPDPMVRAQCVDLLADDSRLGDPQVALKLFSRWSADDEGDARAAALTAALKASAEDGRGVVLDMAKRDPSRMVAAMVVNAARELGLKTTVNDGEPRHGGKWYQDLVAWTTEPRWLDLVTVRGTVRIRLELEHTPITSREVWGLAEEGFYDGLVFHRVVPNFVVQGGDPRGDGWGGPGFVIPDEPSMHPFDSWRAGIATSGPQTGGSQFFFMLQPSDRLTGHYTNFGEVVAGRDVLTRLQVGDTIIRVDRYTGAEPPPPTPVLVGRLAWRDLEALPGWVEEQTAYLPDSASVDRLAAAAGRYRIVTILATWCSDSEREVPRLQRVFSDVGGDRFTHVMVGVDRTKRIHDPEVVADLGGDPVVDLVPTILVFDEAGLELGRIVETAEQPVEELIADFVAASEGWS